MVANLIELSGHSGFEVTLQERGKNFFVVKKKAILPQQNSRLKRQYQKHLHFARLGPKNFSVPEILGIGNSSDLFYYEYKYIEGVTLIHFIEHEPLEKSLNILKNLAEIIKGFQSSNAVFEKREARQRLSGALKKKILANLSHHPQAEIIRPKFLQHIKNLRDFQTSTICHGDLTFDNIIVDKQGKIWLIDFLDSFYPHYWFDISRLFGDIDGKWHEIKYGICLPQNKLIFLRELFLSAVREFDPDYEQHNNFLLAVSFLRTLPYAKSQREREMIIEKINFFLEI